MQKKKELLWKCSGFHLAFLTTASVSPNMYEDPAADLLASLLAISIQSIFGPYPVLILEIRQLAPQNCAANRYIQSPGPLLKHALCYLVRIAAVCFIFDGTFLFLSSPCLPTKLAVAETQQIS